MSDEQRAHDLILGTKWGDVDPPRPIDRTCDPAEDPRTLALRVLRRYISELSFYRRMSDGEPPQPFQIPERSIYIGYPDNDQDIVLPALVMTGSEESYDGFGFQPQLIESSRDKFQPGTVLLHQYTQSEDFTVEIWTGKKPERRAIVAGLQTAFMPSDAYYGLRLRVPDYFNLPVMFTVLNNTRPDNEAIRGRRQAMMRVNYRLEVVQLIAYTELMPVTEVTLMEHVDPRAMECGELKANGLKPPNDWRPVPIEPKILSEWWRSPWLAKWFPFIR